MNDLSANAETPSPEGKANDDARAQIWKERIAAAVRANNDCWEDAKESWDEYLAGRKFVSGNRENGVVTDARYPIWYRSIKYLAPAIYSRTPTLIGKRVNDAIQDDLARLGTIGIERFGNHLIRQVPFDRVLKKTRDTFLHAAKATNRVCVEVVEEEVSQEIAFSQIPAQYSEERQFDENGNELEPEALSPERWVNGEEELGAEEEYEERDGMRYVSRSNMKTTGVRVELFEVHYRSCVHNPDARTEDEIWFKAFKSEVRKSDAAKKFGDDVANALTYGTNPSQREKSTDTSAAGSKDLDPVAVIWEIWDKDKREVTWISEGYDKLLRPLNYSEPDPYKLVGFFPAPPFMIDNIGPDSLFPVPEFIHLRHFVFELHAIFRRLKILIRAARRRGFFDANIPELKALESEADEGEFIAVENFAQLVGEGKMEQVLATVPVTEIVEGIKELVATYQVFKEEFNELRGIPDILRGVTDPNETAAAQQQKGRFLSLSFSDVQREFQRLVRDDIELMIDLGLKVVPDEMIAEIVGVRGMSPEDQKAWPLVLEMLRNDKERTIRIDIETDSTVMMNQNEQIEQRNYLAKTIFEGLGVLVEADPAVKPLVAKALMYVIRGLPEGKELEQEAENSIKKLLEASQNPQPNPEAMKAQAEAQKLQADTQVKMAELQIKQQQLQLDMMRLRLEAEKVQIVARAEGMKAQNASDKTAIEAQAKEFDTFMDAKWLELEKFRIIADQADKVRTDERLERESQMKVRQQAEPSHREFGSVRP